MAEKVAKLGIKRADDMMYYIKSGDVWAVPRKKPGQAAGKAKKVASVGVTMDLASYLYFLDGDGDIARQQRAGVKAAKKSSPKPRADDDDDDDDDDDEAPAPAPKPKAESRKPKAASRDGAAEAAAWCAARAISTDDRARWNVNIALDVVDRPAAQVFASDTDTRFHLDIYRDEWGFVFVHRGKTSHVRRTAGDQFVNGADDHALLAKMPALAEVGAFVRALEAKHKIAFKRAHAHVRTNVSGGAAAIRAWLATL
jgi:hypothetical protein